MQGRDFLKSTVAVAVAAELGMVKAHAKVPTQNWGNYDFGPGPQVTDRLNQVHSLNTRLMLSFPMTTW